MYKMVEICVPTNNICLEGCCGENLRFSWALVASGNGVGQSLTLCPDAHVGCFVKTKVLLFSYLFRLRWWLSDKVGFKVGSLLQLILKSRNSLVRACLLAF